MANVRTPAGTRVYIQSAISAEQALSGITAANPAVVTYVGADPSNGNYIALYDMVGMTEFEDALVKVANVDGGANTFECEDQSAVGYGAFSAGNMKVVTLGNEIRIATGFTMSGGEQNYADYGLLHDTIMRKIPTTSSSAQIDLPVIWDPTDVGFIALQNAARTKAKIGFKAVLPDGLEILAFGYVGASGLPQASDISSIMTSSVSLVLATTPRYILPA